MDRSPVHDLPLEAFAHDSSSDHTHDMHRESKRDEHEAYVLRCVNGPPDPETQDNKTASAKPRYQLVKRWCTHRTIDPSSKRD